MNPLFLNRILTVEVVTAQLITMIPPMILVRLVASTFRLSVRMPGSTIKTTPSIHTKMLPSLTHVILSPRKTELSIIVNNGIVFAKMSTC